MSIDTIISDIRISSRGGFRFGCRRFLRFVLAALLASREQFAREERKGREIDDHGDDDIDDLLDKIRLHRVPADLNIGDKERGEDGSDRI